MQSVSNKRDNHNRESAPDKLSPVRRQGRPWVGRLGAGFSPQYEDRDAQTRAEAFCEVGSLLSDLDYSLAQKPLAPDPEGKLTEDAESAVMRLGMASEPERLMLDMLAFIRNATRCGANRIECRLLRPVVTALGRMLEAAEEMEG